MYINMISQPVTPDQVKDLYPGFLLTPDLESCGFRFRLGSPPNSVT